VQDVRAHYVAMLSPIGAALALASVMRLENRNSPRKKSFERGRTVFNCVTNTKVD